MYYGAGRDSSVGIATRYGVDGPGIESRWGRDFPASVQTDHGAYPASCTMGTGSFPGVKRAGRGADHPPPSKCRGQERVGLYLYSSSGPSWPVIGRTFTFTFTFTLGTDVSEELSASIFMAEECSEDRPQVSPKRLCMCSKLHDIFQRNII